MPTVLLQGAALLIIGQLVLGAVGFAVPDRVAWLGLPLGVLLFWLILRTARALRSEMEAAALKRKPVAPWQMALWATLLWQWPSVLLLPRVAFVPAWLGQVWNGAMLPVQGTLALLGVEIAGWLWVAVVVEALVFALIVGRPVVSPAAVAAARVVETARSQVAAAGEWAPALRHKDVMRRRRNKH